MGEYKELQFTKVGRDYRSTCGQYLLEYVETIARYDLYNVFRGIGSGRQLIGSRLPKHRAIGVAKRAAGK